jgi:hypothetical protein
MILILSSCEEKVRVITPEQARAEAIQAKIDAGKEMIYDWDIQEFEYKRHTYMYNIVRDGISAWHAGHCKCNPNR